MLEYGNKRPLEQPITIPILVGNPTNIGIVRGTVSVATIVVVSAGVDI